MIVEQFFGPALRQEKRERVAGVQEREVQPVAENREVRRGHAAALGQETIRLSAHREHLDRPRVDRQRLRLRRTPRALLQHDDCDPGPAQFRGQPHPHRATANHHNLIAIGHARIMAAACAHEGVPWPVRMRRAGGLPPEAIWAVGTAQITAWRVSA